MPQKKQFDRLINFHIDSALLNQLDEFAEKKGWKRNFTIREAIKDYLKKEIVVAEVHK